MIGTNRVKRNRIHLFTMPRTGGREKQRSSIPGKTRHYVKLRFSRLMMTGIACSMIGDVKRFPRLLLL
ncbi:hypothetical protein VTO42DRAFT_8058 [Malbranchea cinnamomea]